MDSKREEDSEHKDREPERIGSVLRSRELQRSKDIQLRGRGREVLAHSKTLH